jgi:hypothetical protein
MVLGGCVVETLKGGEKVTAEALRKAWAQGWKESDMMSGSMPLAGNLMTYLERGE